MKVLQLLIELVGHDRYAFMTVLCDHEYLCGIREKIRLIHDFQQAEKVAAV